MVSMLCYDNIHRVIIAFMIYNIISAFSLHQRIRDSILLKQKNTCGSCYNHFSDTVPHEIHHLNHNSSDNRANNLVAVCCNCHASHHRYNKPINPYFPAVTYISLINNDIPYYKTIKKM